MPNNVTYADQVWGSSTPIRDEQLSVNGYYTGNHTGTPTQDGKHSAGNTDPYYVEHNTVRFGTITQDGSSNANMPIKNDVSVTYILTGCSGNAAAGAKQGTDFIVTFVADAGYTLPSTITVKNNGSPLTVTTDYTYSAGKLTVQGAKITGNLEITVTATTDT